MDLFLLSIGFKKTPPLDGQNTDYAFAYDIAAHFGYTLDTLGKNDRHFIDLKAQSASGKFHFYLKCIAHEAYLIQIYSLQYFPSETDKACGRIRDTESGQKVDIDRCTS